MMRQAISPRFAMRIESIIALHPEDAVRALARVWRIASSRQRECQHAPRVRRIDDPVVPQACRGVVRVALLLVLGTNLLLEGALLFRRPLLTARFLAFTAHDREHRGGLLAAHHRNARV